MRWIMLLAGTAMLSACGSVEPVDNLQSIDTNQVAPTAGVSSADNVSMDGNSVAADSAIAARGISLSPDGLALAGVDGGQVRELKFGMPRAEVEKAVGTVLGAGQTGSACAIAPLETQRYTGVDLSFSDGKFVGWTADPTPGAPGKLTTLSGIGIGSTRTALEQAYKIDVDQSSLGLEFSTQGMAGLLMSEASDAIVTNLWAGQTCVAR